jgi:phage-related protein
VAKDHEQNVIHKVFHILAHGIRSLLAGLASGHSHAFSAIGNARRFVNEHRQSISLSS